MGFAYRQASPDIKPRIKRVADVWRHRQIFPEDVLDKIDEALSDTKKPSVRGAFGGLGGLGSSKFGQSSAPELPSVLSKLASIHKDLSHFTKIADSSLEKANKEYSNTVESDTLPAPKEYARKMQELEPLMVAARLNLTKRITARKEFIEQLNSLASASEILLKEDNDRLEKLESKVENVREIQLELNDMVAPDQQSNTVDNHHPANSKSTTPPFDSKSSGSSRSSHNTPFSFSNDGDENNSETEENANENGARSSTPPAPFLYNKNDSAFGGFSVVDEENQTSTSSFGNSNNSAPKINFDASAPTYADSSDEESDSNLPNKRAKLDSDNDDSKSQSSTSGNNSSTATSFAGLDPKVAQFLSSFAKGALPGSD